MNARVEADLYNGITESSNATKVLIKFLKDQDKRILDLELEITDLIRINNVRDMDND